MANQNLITSIRERVSKIRPYVVAIFIVGFSVSPLVQNPTYKISVAASFGVVLLYLCFDIYRELIQRLEAIEKNLREPNPPTYEDFSAAAVECDKMIKERLNANKDILIRVLGVSAQYSWKHFVEDKLAKFLDIGNRKQKIRIEFVITAPETLQKFNQIKLMADTQRTITGITIMRDAFKTLIEEGRLVIDVFKYDNIPHWHGVLIDDDTFFMGRCRWSIFKENYKLEVGTNEYRLFQINDRFKGTDRVNLCINWFEAYKLMGRKV